MSEEFVYQWSVKLDNGEIFLVRANEELDLVRRVASLKEHINVPAPRSQAKGAPAVYSPSEPDQELESIEIDSITLASGGEHPRWVGYAVWYYLLAGNSATRRLAGYARSDEREPHRRRIRCVLQQEAEEGRPIKDDRR